jgi:hypothetical protein
MIVEPFQWDPKSRMEEEILRSTMGGERNGEHHDYEIP